MYFLVDTNVYLDFLFNREGAEEAAKFFDWCYKRRCRTYVTSISLRDIGYISHRILHSEKEARKILFEVYSHCSKVIGITADDAINSLFSGMNDYEDSLISEAADREMLNAIITNNKKDFKNSKVFAFTPKEMNDIFERCH